MKFAYEPFLLRKLGEGRIFLVNPKMPFEYFVDCFYAEHPFFIVSLLDDGRLSIVPNALVIPQNYLHAGYWPMDLLPTDWEYVTVKNGTYPVIITAHPLNNMEEWLRKFEKLVLYFAKETLWDFVTKATEIQPLEIEKSFKTTVPV